jgi:hypothetical protein
MLKTPMNLPRVARRYSGFTSKNGGSNPIHDRISDRLAGQPDARKAH